jgi:protein-S-isoprenylcysteine O-methyltransferase Ste14
VNRDHRDRIRRVNDALVVTGGAVFGLLAVGAVLGSAYRAMQGMSYETMPSISPVEIYLGVTGVAIASVVLVLGMWGHHAGRRDRKPMTPGDAAAQPETSAVEPTRVTGVRRPDPPGLAGEAFRPQLERGRL